MAEHSFIDKLQSIGISSLYHLTDKDNLISIIKERGIFSVQNARDADIVVSRPGGTAITHRLDARHGRDGCVHLFPTAPTEDVLRAFSNQGRFGELFSLEISLKALRPGRTFFWIGDPYDGGERIEDINTLLERVQKDPAALASLSIDVEGSIHYNYLLNIPEDIESRISEVHPTAIVFAVDISRSMSRGAEIDSVQYDSISEVAAIIINKLIEHFLERCVSAEGEVNHLYDIAVIGYGDGVSDIWNGDLSGKDFHTPVELMWHSQSERDRFRWVDPRDDDSKSRSDLGMERVLNLMSAWVAMKENKYSYPPTVIHISDGDISPLYQRGFLKAAESLKRLETTDKLVLWNVGISPYRSREYLLMSGEDLPLLFHHGTDSTVMYEASSYLPERFKIPAASIHKGDPTLERRTMAINMTAENLIELLQLCVLPE